jgi:hypothetical protein
MPSKRRTEESVMGIELLKRVKLYPVAEDSGELCGFYAKGLRTRKDILNAVDQEFPDFYEENISGLEAAKMRTCFLRVVPCHPNSEMGLAGFKCQYWETSKSKGAFFATSIYLGD